MVLNDLLALLKVIKICSMWMKTTWKQEQAHGHDSG